MNLHFWPCWGSTNTQGRCQIIHVMRVWCRWWGSYRFCIVQPVGEGEEPALFCTFLFFATSLPLICAPKTPRIWKGVLRLKLQCSIAEKYSKAKVEMKQNKRKSKRECSPSQAVSPAVVWCFLYPYGPGFDPLVVFVGLVFYNLFPLSLKEEKKKGVFPRIAY